MPGLSDASAGVDLPVCRSEAVIDSAVACVASHAKGDQLAPEGAGSEVGLGREIANS